MRKIIVISLLLIFAVNTVAFAATPTTSIYFGDGSETFTATEDSYTVEVYLDPTDEMMQYSSDYGLGTIQLTFAATNGTVSLSDSVKITGTTNATNANILYFQSNGSGYTGYSDTPILLTTATITREGDSEKTEITFSGFILQDKDGTDYSDGSTPGKITINWPSAGEEEFTVENALATGDTMMIKDSSGKLVEAAADATNARVIAVFAKAVESKLDAQTYGIVFGGVKYPGKLAVEAGNSWAVKLIIPNGMLEKGSYDYGTYVGSAEPVIAASPFVVE